MLPQLANTTYFSAADFPAVEGLVALTIDDGICRGGRFSMFPWLAHVGLGHRPTSGTDNPWSNPNVQAATGQPHFFQR